MRTYTEADTLFKKYLTMIDTRPLSRWEMREGRRDFLRAFVHHTEDRAEYINHAYYELEAIQPSDTAKSRIYDFDLIKEYEAIIEQMEQF